MGYAQYTPVHIDVSLRLPRCGIAATITQPSKADGRAQQVTETALRCAVVTNTTHSKLTISRPPECRWSILCSDGQGAHCGHAGRQAMGAERLLLLHRSEHNTSVLGISELISFIWRAQSSSAAPQLALRTFLLQTQVAYTIGWTAVSSELTYYTSLYGPEILLWLNVSGCAALCGCRHLVSVSEMCRRAPILGLVLPGGLLRAVCARHDAPDADRRKVRPCIRGCHRLSIPLCCR